MPLLLKTLCLAALSIAAAAICALPATAQDSVESTVANPDGSTIRVIKNVPYVTNGEPGQKLDLFLPRGRGDRLPTVVFIHGGGWSGGDKKDASGIGLAQQGYAVASLNYRLASKKARWPAQVTDCKAAVRWMRANAAKYGFDTTRFIACGHSAGAHLAAFLGTTNGAKQFDVGENLNRSSDVQAVVWCSGVSDMIALSSTPGYELWLTPTNGAAVMLGNTPLAVPELAAIASPISYVNPKTVPYIIFHGTGDNLVAVSQAIEMFSALKRAGVPTEMHLVKDGDHNGRPPGGGPGYFSPEFFAILNPFLSTCLHIPANSLGNGYSKPSATGPGFVTFDYPPAVIQRLLTGDPYKGNLADFGNAIAPELKTGESTLTPIADAAGLPGYRCVATPNVGPRFVYFTVPAKYKNGAVSHVIITVPYLDKGPDSINVVYDSSDQTQKGANGPGSWKKAGAIDIGDTGKWRFVRFELKDALFNSRLNGFDIRLEWNQNVDAVVGGLAIEAR